MPGRNLKLLCLDGGGVRGLSSLYILQRLMDSIDSEHPPKPCEYFDIIGGTSTGGLIAIMLGRLEMDVDSCIKSYLRLCKAIFSDKKLLAISLNGNIRARFKTAPLEKAIKQIIVEQGFAEDELLKDPNSRCKVFVCATSGDTSTPILLKSYPSPRGTRGLYDHTRIWEAARATSAAPTFFDPIRIGPTKRTFGDGATGANNPVNEIWNEAIDLCDGEPIDQNLACIVSIGTGVRILKKFGENVKEVVESISRISTQTENTANNFHRSHPELTTGQRRYFRFNATGGLAEIGLDEESEVGTIEDMTDVYLKDENVFKQVQQCAKIIAENNQVPAPPMISPASFSLGLKMTDRHEWRVELSQDGISGADLFQRLSNYSYQRQYGWRARQKLKDTAEWILKESQFKSWLHDGEPRCLWLTGIIGCGKSITLTTVIDQAFIVAQKNGRPVLHYFFNHSFRRYLTARALFESYTKQLLYHLESIRKRCPPDVIRRLVDFYGPKKRPPSLGEVVDELIMPLLAITNDVIFIVDGLDECRPNEIQNVLAVFKKLLTDTSSRVFIACREEADILRRIQGSIRIRITPEKTMADLELFIDHTLESMQSNRRISDSVDMLAYIKEELLKKADRMFLWAELQIQLLWKNCAGEDAIDDTIYKSLRELPEDLNEIYRACQKRVNQDERRQSLANKTLKLLCAAMEPFQINQLQEALVVDPQTGELKSGPIHKDELMACCGSLVYLEDDSKHELILLSHYSVRQFLLATLQVEHDTAELELGELCIAHLHKHMPVRDLTLHGKESFLGNKQINVTMPTSIMSTIASTLAPRRLQPRTFPAARPRTFRLPAPAPRISTTFHRETFLYYAKENWTLLTRYIAKDSRSYAKFENVALSKNKAWWIYPWQMKYESDNSHVFAIYGWSIMHCHYGLLALAIDPKLRVDKTIYTLPLYESIEQRSLLPFQAAAEIGNTQVAELLLEVLPLEDRLLEEGLRIATMYCHEQMVRLLLERGVNVNARKAGQQSLLQIADQESHEPIRRLLLEAGALPCLWKLEGHSDWVMAVAFSPDDKQLASASHDHTVILWHTSSGELLRTLKGHSNRVMAVAFSPDGKQLASASHDKTVRLWHASSGALLQTLKGHSNRVIAVAFSPDGKQLASASHDRTVRLWHASSGTLLRTLKGHSNWVMAVAFSPDGKQLASASHDKTVRLWHASWGALLQSIKGHSNWVRAVAFSPDGKQLASASGDHTVRLWHAGSGALLQTLNVHSDQVNLDQVDTVAFSPDSKQLASVSGDYTVRLWHAGSGAMLQTLEGHSEWVSAVAFSPDGKMLASGSKDYTVRLWHTRIEDY